MMRFLHKFLLTLTLMFMGSWAVAQTTVSGKVVDEQGEGLPGANVVIKGTNIGTVTNFEGIYTLEVNSPSAILIFSFVGYATKEEVVSGRSVVDVSLAVDITALSEVVVIGYGTSKKTDLVGAVSQIDSKQIEELPVASFEQALSGQVSGVQLRQTGQPGGGPEVLIRGVNSIGTGGSNRPLFVIDGFPIGNSGDNADNFVLSSISPDEIESISVLKDATSKAIYGSRAAAGVVIITTKRGKKGKPKISFNSYVGIQQIPDYEKPDILNATELAQFRREQEIDRIRVTENIPLETAIPEDRIPEAFRNPEQYGEGTDWFDEITRNAFQQNYNINISGGTDNVKYTVSGSYLDQEGTLINSSFERYNFRASVDAKINERLRYGSSLAVSHARRQLAGAVAGTNQFNVYSALTSSLWADPSAPVNNPDGTLNTTTQGDLIQFFTASPVARLSFNIDDRRTNQVLMSNYLEFEPIEGLVAKSTLNVIYTDRRTERFTPSFLPGNNLTPNPEGSGVASASAADVANLNIINENTLTYTTTIASDHNITALAGISFEDRESETTTAASINLLDERILLPTFDNTSKNNVSNFEIDNNRKTGAGFGANRLISFYSRLNYAYKDKYYVTAAFRRDGSSRFGSGQRYANFPAVAGAWRISAESFYQNSGITDIINDLKVEVSYGFSGSNALGNFQAQGAIGLTNYNFGASGANGGNEVVGNSLNTLRSTEVTWEQTEQLDIGLDIGLLSNKITLGIDLYRAISEDFIVSTPLPRATGFKEIIDNAGSIENRGIEIELATTDLVKSGKFSYDLSANFTANRNEVLEIQNTLFRGAAGNSTQFTITQEGEPIGQYYGIQITGLFTEEEINDPNVPKYPGAQVGSVNYVDADGDGNLEQFEDYVVIGNPLPDFIFGMTHNFRYANFDLRMVWAGAVGQQIFELRREIQSNFDGVFNLHSEVKDRYRPGDDPTTKSIPTTVGTTNRWRIPSSASVFDASYMFVRNITLGYNLPNTVLSNFFSSARVYASVQNPFLFTEYERGNPEVSRVGDNATVRNVNNGQYPISRIYTIGFNVTF